MLILKHVLIMCCPIPPWKHSQRY